MKENLWIVLGPRKKIGYKKFIYAKCKCGTERFVMEWDIIRNRSRSCGCLQVSPGTHRMSKTPTYKTWTMMKIRCNNPKNPLYKWYGGRGIRICKRWNVFENFLEDMGTRPTNHSIDRINNNKGYYPKNCRWITQKEQLVNTSRNIFFEFNGEKKALSQISELTGIEYSILYKNIFYRGFSLEEAIFRANTRTRKPRHHIIL